MTDSFAWQWILALSSTTLILSLAVLVPIVSRYAKAYLDTPSERLEDRLRLARLLRGIQRGGDALREELNALLIGEGSPRLHNGARLCWASHRQRLEEKVRRLDLLRMRFLVVHMAIITGTATETAAKKNVALPESEKSADLPLAPRPGALPKALADDIKSKAPLGRLTVQAIGYQENVEGGHRKGWAGVVMELQKSPVLRERHASIELAMSRSH
ncbi:hypothetical protein VTH82DRAFT_2307 [Thermothelomyces myriococcoides]